MIFFVYLICLVSVCQKTFSITVILNNLVVWYFCSFFQFLNLFGDVQSIKRAEDRHAKLFLPHRSMSELKKRHAEDFLASDKAKMARSYSVPSPAQSSMAAYPNAQNQWATGYGVQPQTWPPVTQAQGQQWTAGYTQQVDYYF